MSTEQSRIISTGVLFLAIFLSGFRLRRSGKPYALILFNGHKLIALGALAYFILTIIRLHRAAPLVSLQLTATIFAVVFFVATIATGGLVSLTKPMPAFVPALHRLLPWLTAFSTAATLYLLAGR